MTDKNLTKLERLQHEGELTLENLQKELDAFGQLFSKNLPKAEDEDSDDGGSQIEHLRTLQLVLQFRLDSQDALNRLFRFSQSIWQVLGVSAQYSSTVNKERLSFALGADDLHQALSMLSQLIDALLRVLQRHYSHRLAPVGFRKQPENPAPVKEPILSKKMVRIVQLQKTFNTLTEQLELTLEDAIEGAPQIGPILDYITKLEGSISRFKKAIEHGLVAAGGLYQQLEAKVHFNKKIDELLHQANLVLGYSQPILEKPRLFRPTNTKSPTLTELDERAHEKRMGKFFFHP